MLKMRKTLYTICKLFKLTVPISKVLFSIVLLCYLLLSLIPLIQIFVTVKLVDQVALIISEGAQHMRHGYWLAALQGALLLIYAAIQAVNQQVSMRWRQKVQYELDHLIISKTISLPLVYFEMPSFQDKVQMVSLILDNVARALFC